MSDRQDKTERLTTYRDEVRDTVVKSSLSGVAATVLAVTISSPAGLGGMIGTSLASGAPADSAATADALSNLSPYPAPITQVELREIRQTLRDSALALREARRDTNAEIAHIRSIAAGNHIVSVAPMAEVAQVGAGMSVTDEAAPSVEVAQAPVEQLPVAVEYDAPQAQLMTTAELSYGGGDEYGLKPRDRNMELAELLLTY